MLKNMLRRSSSNHYKSHAYTKREIAVQLNAIIKEDLQLFLDLSNGRDFTLFASTCVEVATDMLAMGALKKLDGSTTNGQSNN